MSTRILQHLKYKMLQLRMLANIKWMQKTSWEKVMRQSASTLTVSNGFANSF